MINDVGDIYMDYETQTKLIDKAFELADALAADDVIPAVIFADFKQELADLGFQLALIPKQNPPLTPQPPK